MPNLNNRLIPQSLRGSLLEGGYILEGIIEGDTDAVYYPQNWRLMAKSGAGVLDNEWREVFNGHLLNDPDTIKFGRSQSNVQIIAGTLDKHLQTDIQDIGFVSIAGADNHAQHQLQDMQFGDMVDHIMRYHCNVIYDATRMEEGIVTDVDIDTTNSTAVSRFNVYKSKNLWRTVQDLGGGDGSGEFYYAFFTKSNGFRYQPAPVFTTTPPSAKGTLTAAHIRGQMEVKVRNNSPRDRIGQVQLTGFNDWGTLFNANYPSDPERGRIETPEDGIFVTDQARADTLAERIYKWLTRPYTVKVQVDPGLVLFGGDGDGLEIGDKVNITYDGIADDLVTGAGVAVQFNQQPFIVYEIEINFDVANKTATAILLLEYDPTTPTASAGATWRRYTSPISSLEVQSFLGQPFFVRSFCDDPSGAVYTTKAPVCKLSLDPTTQFINEDIAWDISKSSSPTGTIDTFDITWGATTDIGNKSGESFGGTTSGNVQFQKTGEFTVKATVTDTLGNKSAPCEVVVEILPAEAPNDIVYVGTTDGGCFLISAAGGVVQSNGSLTGDSLKFRSMRLHPAYRDLPSEQRHLWACTKTGLAYSTDGATTWVEIAKAALGTPENAAGDATAPTTADIDPIDIDFDPQSPDNLAVLCTSSARSWLYKSTNYGATWNNEQLRARATLSATSEETWAANTRFPDAVALDADRIAIAYVDGADSNKPKVVAVDISSGSPVTIGTPVELSTGSSVLTQIVLTEAGQVVCYWRESFQAKIAAVSFAALVGTKGTTVDIGGAGTTLKSGIVAMSATRLIVVRAQATNLYGYIVSKSGNSLALGTEVEFFDDNGDPIEQYSTFFGACPLTSTRAIFTCEFNDGVTEDGRILQVSSAGPALISNTDSKTYDSLDNDEGAGAVQMKNGLAAIIVGDSNDTFVVTLTARGGTIVEGEVATLTGESDESVAIDRISDDEAVLFYGNTAKAQTATLIDGVFAFDGNEVTGVSSGNPFNKSICVCDDLTYIGVWNAGGFSAGKLSIITQTYDYDIIHSADGIPGSIKI